MFSTPAPRSSHWRRRDGEAGPARGGGGGGGGGGGAMGASFSTPLASQNPSTPRHGGEDGGLARSASQFLQSTPWSHRSAMAARTPPVLRSTERNAMDESQPVFVSGFPQELRTAQAEASPAQRLGAWGGMDEKTGLCWMLQSAHLFIWSHMYSRSPEKCWVLAMPSQLCSPDGQIIDSKHGDNWALCIVDWQEDANEGTSFAKDCKSAGIVMCSRKSLAVVYWSDIFVEACEPVVSLPGSDSPSGAVNRRLASSWSGAPSASYVNSMVACAVRGSELRRCVAIACRSSGELWRFDCSLDGITRNRLGREMGIGPARGELSSTFFVWNSSCARSIVWRYSEGCPKEGWQQFFLLTATGLECWDIELGPGGQASLAWSFDVLMDLTKDLAGQKQVWLLDLRVDAKGKVLTLLLASYSKDRLNSSSYTQYSLATLHCDSDIPKREGGVQVILPKARIEEEEFLYSMRLRVGGKPEGSAMILAGDGTATVAYYSAGTVRLYQFDLAWDAGKVIDAIAMASPEDGEEGTWLVLTEKAGLWAIPGKAVLYCGVEPPERSLSRRGSSNEGTAREERRWLALGENFITGKLNFETGAFGDARENAVARARPFHDEEAEAVVGGLFQEFLASGQVERVLDKLEQAGAFEREGEMNAFARVSRGLVDTLPKQWSTGRVVSAAAVAAVSSQLLEKQQRHLKFLHFLAASKCHEELQQRQKSALHTILEHGEKLASMIQLRELHNASAQARRQCSVDSPKSTDAYVTELGGALWDLVRLVGEKARRNNIILMDREKAEVFYSQVSDLEDLFSCINNHVSFIVGGELPLHVQIERICEISHACTEALRAAIRYRDSQHSWYPPPEGLMPWYCKPSIRTGLWKLSTMILELSAEAVILEPSIVSTLVSQLEEVADVLLEAYAGAITAKVEREEEYRGLQAEYWSRRDTLLGALQQHAKNVAEAEAHGAGGEEHRFIVLQKLYAPLVSLARRHAGYQTLWNICTDLNDMEFLRSLMHESMGLKEARFSNFVFEQCYCNHQYAKLLRLGEEFQEDLAQFLQSHKDLLWLHELFMQRFTLASSTLHLIALSKERVLLSPTVDLVQGHLNVDIRTGRLKVAQRRQLLNLAKLSALAGGAKEAELRMAQIDAEIGMLGVQEVACSIEAVPEDEFLTPRQLVEVCLKSKNRDLVLRAFDVFAWGGDAFRRSNRSLLESAWLRVADQDNWTRMRQTSEREGWSDDQHLQALQSTALFYVAQKYYSHGSYCFGGTFHDILPLCHEDLEEKGTFVPETIGVNTVETVLMRHPDFPDAGQAMLTTIRMGKSMGIELDERDVNGVMAEM